MLIGQNELVTILLIGLMGVTALLAAYTLHKVRRVHLMMYGLSDKIGTSSHTVYRRSKLFTRSMPNWISREPCRPRGVGAPRRTSSCSSRGTQETLDLGLSSNAAQAHPPLSWRVACSSTGPDTSTAWSTKRNL